MQSATVEPTTAWDREAVTEFTTGNADILVLERCPFEDHTHVVQSGRTREYLAPVRRERVGPEVRAGLGELRIKSSELASDLISLVTSFLDQFELLEARLRIEITRSQPCPKFHSDNVHVRLVTTYVGPATEYQYSGESLTQVAPLHGLVFLKGRRHTTHRDTVHHRSPEVPRGTKRLCVAIDY